MTPEDVEELLAAIRGHAARGDNESGHIGDWARGIGPSTPEVGEEIALGTGTLFTEYDDGVPRIGVKPDDGRETDWMDPRALYRCHNQTVRLEFRPA